MLVVILFAAAVSAQDQQPTDKDTADTTQAKQLQELQNQKREIEARYDAAHESVTAAKQQLANADPKRTLDERTQLQAELSKLQVQEMQLSAMLEATNRLIDDVHKDQSPADSDKHPFTATLLLVKADWSTSPKAKEIAAELREALKGLNVPQEQLDKLPASATEILFPPNVEAVYRTLHWKQFHTWLQDKELIVEDHPFEIIAAQKIENPGFGGARMSAPYAELGKPYSFLDLPPLTVENNQPFFKWGVGFRWRFNWGQPMARGLWTLSLYRGFVLDETAHGEEKPRVKEALDGKTWNLYGLREGQVAVMNAFSEPVLLEAAARKGFTALIVVRGGEGGPKDAGSRLVLPDNVKAIQPQSEGNFDFGHGGTLIVEQEIPGRSRAGRSFAGDGVRWKEEPKPARKPPVEKPAAEQPNGAVIKVFTLRNIKARDAERIVQQLFGRDIQSAAADERTNSLIVRGSEEQLKTIYEILNRLDEPEAKTSEKPAQKTPPAAGQSEPAATASVEELTSAFEKKDRQAIWLAGQIREQQATPKPNQATLDKLSADLRSVVGQAFALRQQLHQAELAKLHERMQGIQQTIEARSRISDAIISRRVEDLLNPNLEWTAPVATAVASRPAAPPPPTSSVQPRVQYGTYWSPEAEQVLKALGLETQKLTRDDAPEPKLGGSLKITAIAPDSAASELRVGDIITMVQITSSGGRNSAVRKAQLQIRRGDENIPVYIEFPAETPSTSTDNRATPPSTPKTAAPALSTGSSGATVTLRTPDEFRNRLSDADHDYQRLQKWGLESFEGHTAEERAKTKEAAVQAAKKRLEFTRAEYAAQIRLLELEANAAKADLKDAEEAEQNAVALHRFAKADSRRVIDARRQVAAARLRLERATTLLDLYRKADPQAGTGDSKSKPPQ